MHGDIFYKVALFNEKGSSLGASNVGVLGDENRFLAQSGEIAREALEKNTDTFKTVISSEKEQFFCVAIPFTLEDKHFVLVGAYPTGPMQLFYESFNFWFAFICLAAVCIFSLFTILVFKRLHRPISKMISAISSYQNGKKDALTELSSQKGVCEDDDLGRLSQTLVALSETVKKQLVAISHAKDEREAILETLCEGVVAVDSCMRIDYINFIGAKMLGVAKKLVMGKEFDEGVGSRYDFFITKCKELLITAQMRRQIVTDSISIENTSKIYYDIIAAPRPESGGTVLVIQDRSSQQKVLEMGKDFVANASHELRTPITIIKGFAETLQDMKEMPHDMLSSIVEKIVRNCERMENLVSNLLTLADLENLSISPYVRCDIVPLIETCMDIVRGVYSDAHIELHTPGDSIFVAADSSILELAIINLLTNAAKYSKGPADIHVTITPGVGEVKIAIADRGIGIPEADVGQIFQRFYTVDKAHSRRLGGAGLGLSLVKTIIDKHHGTIEVASKLGAGTTFTILLPQPKGS
jgi:two-component system phosphate regulon sensor histidine kinase PhoR